MYILTVIPLARGVFAEELTYFTVAHVAVGSLITVPLRGRTIHALVVKEESARDQKSTLKQQSFAVRKIDAYKASTLVGASFVQACLETADYFCQRANHVLTAQIPKLLISSVGTTPESPTPALKKESKHASRILILQMPEKERFVLLKRHIRDSFARGNSVFVLFPTVADMEAAVSQLGQGIETSVHSFHGSMPKGAFTRQLKIVREAKHPLLVVGTAQFLALPIPNLGSIIVEQEQAQAYVANNRPYVDQRVFARLYAAARGIDLVYAATCLSLESLDAYERGQYEPLAPVCFRPQSDANISLVDMRSNAKSGQLRESFQIIGKELGLALTATEREESRIFLFAHRKGLAPITLCQDCETVVSCSVCTAPLVLVTTPAKEQIFRCNSCRTRRAASDRCITCGGWRLKMLGIGIEQVEHELKLHHPLVRVFRLDADTIRSHRAAKQLLADFKASHGSVLLGTELALYYLHDAIARSAVVSLDSLLAVPNFRIGEKVLHLLFRLRELATEACIVQTRKPDDALFSFFLDGDIERWCKQTVAERTAFHYPPATVLVKIQSSGKGEQSEATLQSIAARYHEFRPHLYKSRQPKKEAATLQLLLRVPQERWPIGALTQELQALPPDFHVQVNPESLL